MAIARDGSIDGGTAFAAALSWAHTCSGADRVLFVQVAWVVGNGVSADPSTAALTVTYNSTPMTLVGRRDGPAQAFAQGVALYVAYGPVTGGATVAFSYSHPSAYAALGMSASYTGLTGTVDVTQTNSASASADFATSLTPTSTGGWTIYTTKNDVGAPTSGTGSSPVQTSTNGMGLFDSNGAVSAGSSYTMHATGSSANWLGVMAAFGNGGGGGGTTYSGCDGTGCFHHDASLFEEYRDKRARRERAIARSEIVSGRRAA